MPSSGPEILDIDRIEIAVEPWTWPFAVERRDDIARHFAKLQGDRPGVWNGRVLLLQRYAVAGRVLSGACFETDFASFAAWRHWNFADPAVANVFAAAALRSADGAYLLGEMAADTAAAGRLYFPCGTPDPDDLDATGRLDLAKNMRRELKEETGLDIAEFAAEPGWNVVIDRGYVAVLKRAAAALDADALAVRVRRYLASEQAPELADIRIVRGLGDLDYARMPRFVTAYLEQVWRR